MRYFSTPGAGLAYREDSDFEAPANWRTLTEDQYNARKAVIDERLAIHIADRVEEIAVQRKVDYDEIVAAGIPERVAERLTGHKDVGESPVKTKGGKS